MLGADGIASAFVRLTRAELTPQASDATAKVFGYFAGISDAGYLWHSLEGASVGRIPPEGGRIYVFVSVLPACIA
jgi:hypothetical protein